MGYVSAGDEFNMRMDILLEGVERSGKIVDDNILYDDDYETHKQRVIEILCRCREQKLTMSPKKFVYAQPEIEYCGYIIIQSGWRIDPKKVETLKNFPVPRNRTDLRSFLGLVQQFSDFSQTLSINANRYDLSLRKIQSSSGM